MHLSKQYFKSDLNHQAFLQSASFWRNMTLQNFLRERIITYDRPFKDILKYIQRRLIQFRPRKCKTESINVLQHRTFCRALLQMGYEASSTLCQNMIHSRNIIKAAGWLLPQAPQPPLVDCAGTPENKPSRKHSANKPTDKISHGHLACPNAIGKQLWT